MALSLLECLDLFRLIIPSDYSIDFTKFKDGENRNLDLRREFHQYLDSTSIAATSIFNGAFMDMLCNEIPMIIFKKNSCFIGEMPIIKWALQWFRMLPSTPQM